MNLYEEIRDIAGVDDVEYISEGIVFFKNSSKIKRLAKYINQKREKLLKKGDMKTAKELKPLYDEAIKVANTFEILENEFKKAKGSEKGEVKAKYKLAEVQFRKLIKIAKKDSTKRALAVAGGVAVVAAILVAGIFGLQSLQASGALAGAESNIGARVANLKNSRVPDSAITNTGNLGVDRALGRGIKGIANFANDQNIKATNKDLLKTVGVGGAVAGGLISTKLIQRLKKEGRKNKLIADTALALESLDKVSNKTEKEQ